MALLVKDMLQRPHFENATIIAGKNGLNRPISWAHIIELEQFGHLLNGREVILTTGIGWAENEEKSLAYLQQLLDYHASALCVELVVHIKQLPKKMLALAEANDFPIISFDKEVRFVDITKDLHEQIIGQQEDIWLELERFHQRLHYALTTDGTIGDFLRILHQETGHQIVLRHQDEYRFFPSPAQKRQKQWEEELVTDETVYDKEPVYLLQDPIGSLLFLEPIKSISRFDKLALKRCSEVINQYFWRHHHQMEVQRMEKNKWLLEAIHSPQTHEKTSMHIHRQLPDIALLDAVVGIHPEPDSPITKDKKKSLETNIIMSLRTALKQFGLEMLTVKDTEHAHYILLIIQQQPGFILEKLDQALQMFYDKREKEPEHRHRPLFGFGKAITNYAEISKSYQTAMSTLRYQQAAKPLPEPFYSKLGIYRLVDQINDKKELEEVVEDYIGPLLAHDKEKGTELTKTLKIYLKRQGQKNETAAELHIVRQTLYHRLHKIEQLLGPDYMHPENRFMIEFSLHILRFMP